MAVAGTRTFGLALVVGAGVMALRPIGPLRPLGDMFSLPARLAAPLGMPTRLVARWRESESTGSDERTFADEAALSERLERSVSRSAWPEAMTVTEGIDPIPGEVEARRGRSRDIIRVRVPDPSRVEVGQPVVAGDVYVGRVALIPFRDSMSDRPGLFERLMRLLRLSSAPVAPPRDAVDVALITGAGERVGGHIVEDQNGRSCDLVVGGLAPRDDQVWLAVHTPESRATRSGRVVVREPLGLVERADSPAEGYLIGDLTMEVLKDDDLPFDRTVLGIRPLIDFSAGLNQVLILAKAGVGQGWERRSHDPRRGPEVDVVRVMEDGGWAATQVLAIGDTSPWRAALHIDCGKGAGVREGAAVVDGVRLVGRVAHADSMMSSVVTLADPGFRVSVLAQSAADPDAPPFAMGTLDSLGRTSEGVILLRWAPALGLRYPDWMSPEPMPVVLWTGSGMARVPRGLRLGVSSLGSLSLGSSSLGSSTGSSSSESRTLEVREIGASRARLRVRTGSARLSRSRPGGGE